MERLANDPERVEREFADMKAAGTTVARIHPEMSHFLTEADQVDPQGLTISRSSSRLPRPRASAS